MLRQGDEDVPWDSLSVGATRPAMLKGFDVPFWFIVPILAIPMLVVLLTSNPMWLVLIPLLVLLARWLIARDHNRPRVIMLSFMSGAMFADRGRWGGDSVDPLGKVNRNGD